MYYIYESHLGGLYASGHELEFEDLYCETCGDRDWYVGYVTTKEEMWKILINEYEYEYDKAKDFIESYWCGIEEE